MAEHNVTDNVIVGFNIRTAFRNTELPVGGGPTGRNPVSVSQGTHVGKMDPIAFLKHKLQLTFLCFVTNKLPW